MLYWLESLTMKICSKLSYDEIFQNCQDLLKQAFELTNQDWDCHRMLCNTMYFGMKKQRSMEEGYNLNRIIRECSRMENP